MRSQDHEKPWWPYLQGTEVIKIYDLRDEISVLTCDLKNRSYWRMLIINRAKRRMKRAQEKA
jgi:hypothetical protein